MTEYNLSLPALTTSSVFVIRSSISIDAPKQKVWDILLDFASYKEWCVCLCNSRPPSITKPSLLCTGTHICAAPFFSGSSVFFPSPAADPCELAANKRSSAMAIRSTSFPKQQHQAAVLAPRATLHGRREHERVHGGGDSDSRRRPELPARMALRDASALANQRGTLADPAGRQAWRSEDCIRDVGVFWGFAGICDPVLYAHKAARLV